MCTYIYIHTHIIYIYQLEFQQQALHAFFHENKMNRFSFIETLKGQSEKFLRPVLAEGWHPALLRRAGCFVLRLMLPQNNRLNGLPSNELCGGSKI